MSRKTRVVLASPFAEMFNVGVPEDVDGSLPFGREKGGGGGVGGGRSEGKADE